MQAVRGCTTLRQTVRASAVSAMSLLMHEMDENYVQKLLKEKENRKPKPRLRALVMVLGDMGHSPRMQYHVASLEKEGFDVDFMGFHHSDPRQEILHKPSIDLHPVQDVPKWMRKLPRLIYLPLRVVFAILSLMASMWKLKKPDLILIQNPPTIPIVFCAFVFNFFWQAALVLDWHNYSYSILAITMKGKGLLRRIFLSILEKCEGFAAQNADANLCVTKAMAADMKQRWKASAATLYDRPPEDFGPAKSIEALHFLFMKLGGFSPVFRSLSSSTSGSIETVFTAKEMGQPATLKLDRPAMIISSTSWTEDEDFGLFFDALKLYDMQAKDVSKRLPKLIVVVTGKGPMKEYYMKKAQNERMKNVDIVSFWLETADYPRMLGSADLGVCLHYSSSGLDLPMKVVDMFGCGLPVCAVDYNCIEELIRPRENGLLFRNAEELCQQLCDLLPGFPSMENPKLDQMRQTVQGFRKTTWHSNWKEICHRVLTETVQCRKETKVDIKKKLLKFFIITAFVSFILTVTFNMLADLRKEAFLK